MAGVPRLPGAYQPFEEETHSGPVIDRATFLPIGQYDDGSLTFAWPGFLKDAWEGGQRTYLDAGNIPVPDAAPGTRWSSNVDALNAASIAPMAGVAGRVSGAIPRGALGSGGSDMVTKPKGFTVYHGSPHDYKAERLIRWPDGREEYIEGLPDVMPDIPDGATLVRDYPLGRMRMDRVGTGEGAQAYGHGWYGAENEKVARWYRDKLADTGVASPSQGMLGDALAKHPGDYVAARAEIMRKKEAYSRRWGVPIDKLPFGPLYDDAIKLLDRAIADPTFNPTPGSMYEVRINAEPEQFLDWDKPLSQQSAIVERMRQSGIDPDQYKTATGGDFYNWTRPDGMTAEQWGAKLRQAGIPGIRYLDQGSRLDVRPGSTYNYVVFDDALVEILRKYANPETAALPYLFMSQPNDELPAWRPMD